MYNSMRLFNLALDAISCQATCLVISCCNGKVLITSRASVNECVRLRGKHKKRQLAIGYRISLVKTFRSSNDGLVAINSSVAELPTCAVAHLGSLGQLETLATFFVAALF